MILYNVTVKVEPSIAPEWERWLIDEHAPEMMATTCFTRYQLVRLLEVDESDGPTYAIQYYTNDLTSYRRYRNEFAATLQKAATDKWGQQFVSFPTLMKIIQ